MEKEKRHTLVKMVKIKSIRDFSVKIINTAEELKNVLHIRLMVSGI
jgi:hypothetical protein